MTQRTVIVMSLFVFTKVTEIVYYISARDFEGREARSTEKRKIVY